MKKIIFIFSIFFINYSLTFFQNFTFVSGRIIKQNKVEIPARLTLNFFPTEANSRMGLAIKDNEILENTIFPTGGKKYDDSFWGNFNFIKTTNDLKQIIN